MERRKKTNGAAKPTLVTLLTRAGRCYASLVARIQEFSRVYVLAGELYGQEGRKAIQDKFPLYTASSWELVEAIGKGELLPQLFLCSRHFANGLLRLENSLEKQMKLLEMSKDSNGMVKVEIMNVVSGKTELRPLDELSRIAEDSLLFALKKGGSAAEIRLLAAEYRREFLRQSAARPLWEKAGDGAVVVNRRFVMTLADWEAIGRAMEWSLPRKEP